MTRATRSNAALAALLLTAPLAAAQGGPRSLTPAQMQEDLFGLMDTFESLHAGLRRYATDQDLERAFCATFAGAEEERTVLEFYRLSCELISTVCCGHTSLQMANDDQLAALDQKGVLPLELHFVGDRAWLRRKLADSIPLEAGTEILSIDGMPMAQIQATAFGRMSGDGHIETGKQRRLERDFPRLFGLLVDDHEGFPDQFVVEVSGSSPALVLDGISMTRYQELRTPAPNRRLITLDIDEERDYGLLFVRSFGDPPSPEPDFPTQLEAAFVELREKQIGNLVLDLRGNGGGVDMYGALLVSYMTDEPFGYFDRIEVTPDYEGAAELVESDGMRLMMSHRGLQVQQPAEHRFTGDVYILTDGWTFSTAADVATVAHHNGLATFIGEETGGGYDGNTSGDSSTLGLPSARFTVRVQKWMYTTANVGHAFPGRGVIPHHPVRPSVEDVLAGRDVELAKALELMAAKADER